MLPGATCGQSNDIFSTHGSSTSLGQWIAKTGTLLSAIMASSCCWLPPLLLLMGVSGAGMTKALETYRPLFIVVTFGFLGAAFYLTYRPRRGTGSRVAGGDPNPDQPALPATPAEGLRASVGQASVWRFNMMVLNKAMLWVVTAMAVVFLFFPEYVTPLLGSAAKAITADMHRTVLAVEGMTCKG